MFGGGRRFLQHGSDEGRVIGSLVEIFNHRCLGDFGDVIYHGLKPLDDEDITMSMTTPAAPPHQGPITRARARDLNYVMLLKNEGPEE